MHPVRGPRVAGAQRLEDQQRSAQLTRPRQRPVEREAPPRPSRRDHPVHDHVSIGRHRHVVGAADAQGGRAALRIDAMACGHGCRAPPRRRRGRFSGRSESDSPSRIAHALAVGCVAHARAQLAGEGLASDHHRNTRRLGRVVELGVPVNQAGGVRHEADPEPEQRGLDVGHRRAQRGHRVARAQAFGAPSRPRAAPARPS